jgi:hypothetical protein
MPLPDTTRYLRQKRRSLARARLIAPARDLALGGSVVAVAADRGHHFSKPSRDEIALVEGHGVEGDARAGPFVRLPNLRQVT